jgi:hypothetical protein
VHITSPGTFVILCGNNAGLEPAVGARGCDGTRAAFHVRGDRDGIDAAFTAIVRQVGTRSEAPPAARSAALQTLLIAMRLINLTRRRSTSVMVVI